MSTISLGQTVSGALLSIEMTPVGVRDAVVLMFVAEPCGVDVDAAASKLRDGQHSGRSSEHPINGTSMKWPSAYCNAVYTGTEHLVFRKHVLSENDSIDTTYEPTRRACPVYGTVGSIIVVLGPVLVSVA